MQEFLTQLNDEQIAPVMQTEGAVLVIAGAGSGKTRVLTSRIANLVLNKGVDPYNILAITFTNKAANEMKERLENLIGNVSDMWVCTIHSMCVRILRYSADKIGYDSNFTIYSETDKDKVLKRIIISLTLDQDKYFKNVKNYISLIKNKDLSFDEFREQNPRLKDISDYIRIMEAYEDELKKSNAFDFDDLLIKTYHLLAENRDVLERFAGRFKYIHIDEFQDTNTVQYNIVKLLSFVHKNIFAVGDDDQSIYGWRGAEIDNILNFEKDFKAAKTFKLERNYRSTKKILELANAVISHNIKRKTKVLWTDNSEGVRPEMFVANEESDEAQYTALQIKNLVRERGYKYSDFAVLMRLNALSRSYEQEFMKYGLPCRVYGGFKFFERKEIKDLTAYLRILCNPLDNEAVLRVINVPKRGIGNKSIEFLTDYVNKTGFSVFDAVFDYESLDLNSGAKNKICSYKEILSKLILDKENMGLTELVKSVIDRTDFNSCFDVAVSEDRDKLANVNEFVSSVEEFERANPNATLSEYLNNITLSSDTDEINEGEFVSLATVHSVKGLEYKCVFICGMDDSIFPIDRANESPDELEEERRLLYVAITRAKERLYITRARSRFLYGSRKPTSQSMFLDEVAPVLGISTGRRSYSLYDGDYRRNSSYDDGYSGYDRQERRVGYDTQYKPERTSYSGNSSYFGGYSYTQSTAAKTNSNYGFSGSFKSSNGQTATPIANEKDLSGYVAGAKVKHKKFGEGTIISIKNSGSEIIGDIAFKGYGVKSLVLKMAPIELIKE